VLRYPAIFLVGLFFALGPAPFERAHLNAANRSVARIKLVARRGAHSGSKPLPVRPPIHNPSTCVICAALHSPVIAHYLPPTEVGPTAFVGYLSFGVSWNYAPVSIAAEQCRGPPTA
jgi:hypothetical protein